MCGDGITAEDSVFIGPNATFANDKTPRSQTHTKEFERVLLRKHCSIGANATIIGPCEIGEYALIAAGTVVTKSIPPYALVVGNPGRVIGFVNSDGQRMKKTNDGFLSSDGKLYQL